MSKLSALLRNARECKGWTKAELADRSEIPIQTISRYEDSRWKGKPDVSNVIALAYTLDIPDEDWLAALDIPLRRSITPQQRDERYAEVVALTEDDVRFKTIAEMWKKGAEEERDAALSVLESIFKRDRPPVRRRLRKGQ